MYCISLCWKAHNLILNICFTNGCDDVACDWLVTWNSSFMTKLNLLHDADHRCITFHIGHPLPFSVSVFKNRGNVAWTTWHQAGLEPMGDSSVFILLFFCFFPSLYYLFGLNQQSAVLLPGRPLWVVYFCEGGEKKREVLWNIFK